MLYLLKDDNNFYGVYDNINILKNNLNFMNNDEIKIYKINNNKFGCEEIKLEKLMDIKKNKLEFKYYFVFDKKINNFVFYHYDKFFIKNMLKFFNSDLLVIDVIINSILINIVEEEVEEKVENKKLSEKEKIEYYETNRKINLLKQQKKRLEEMNIKFSSDLNLFNKFKEIKKNNKDFDIPPLFKVKFEKMEKLENEDKLTFEEYLKIDDNYIENSYELLFEGGSNINV